MNIDKDEDTYYKYREYNSEDPKSDKSGINKNEPEE